MDSGVGSPRVSRVRLRSRIKRFGSCRGGLVRKIGGLDRTLHILYIS